MHQNHFLSQHTFITPTTTPKATAENKKKVLDFFEKLIHHYLEKASKLVITHTTKDHPYTMIFEDKKAHYIEENPAKKYSVIVDPTTQTLTLNNHPMTNSDMRLLMEKCQHVGRDIDTKKATVFEKN